MCLTKCPPEKVPIIHSSLMDQSHEIRDLISTREILRRSIQESKNVSVAVDAIGSRLNKVSRNLEGLQAAVKNVARKCAVYGIKEHIGQAVAPAAGVVRVLDLVDELEGVVEAGPGDGGLFVYLANVKRLEDALKLLADNCGLLIGWLKDSLHFLKYNASCNDDDWHVVRVSKILVTLVELQGKKESSRLKGGVLCSALDKLEREYWHVLTRDSFSFRYPEDFRLLIKDFSFQGHSVRELQAITEVLAANNGLDRCLSIYAEARIENIRATLQALNLDYLDIELSEAVSCQTVEGYIDQWDEHMEFTVRHLLQTEYRLCKEVYQKVGTDEWMSCFSEIVSQCGFIDIFEFGSMICKCKKEAIKLFKLLKIFSTLDKLRFYFNDLFGGKYCMEIQNRTRDLVRKVVDGACEIFWELLAQVDLQRESSPPDDGSIPRLVHFVTEYCNQLLEDENSVILVSILDIYQVWNQVKFGDNLLSNEIRNIIKALEINLEIWAKGYNDTALSYLFMMNNHWYLCNNLRGTKLGDLMGTSWLWAYEESTEYYAALYMRESWEKLLVFLHEEDITLFPGGRAVDRILVKKRVDAFCEAFDDMYKKQSKWILSDKGLRWKTSQKVVKTIVPPYKSYLQRFVTGVEYECDLGSHVKYTPESLENLISSLFQQKIGKFGSIKCTDMISINNGAVNHFPSTPAAA